MVAVKSRPLAQQLSEKLGGTWQAYREPHQWGWSYREVETGRTVKCYSELSPRYDGDDESCITVYIDDQGVQVGACGMIW